ncbi:MAG: ABC transporter substrate-binding protein [Burkholderiales bacterium]
MKRIVTDGVVLLSATLLALSSVCWAQTKVAQVGILAQREGVALPLFQTFERVLSERGWVPGKNVILRYKVPDTEELRFSKGAQELVRDKVDLIYAPSAPAMHAAFAATRTIPIVTLDYSTDPVTAGYVENYARPGKNVTGIFLDAPQFASKWLEILKGINPKLSKVAVLWDPSPGKVHVDGLQAAARVLGVTLQVHEVRKPEDIDAAFLALRKNSQAVVQLPSPLMYAQSARVGALTRQHKILGISIWRRFSEAGGAVTYGPEFGESIQRSAAIVAKILAGTKASDVPIERPMRFEFLLNMKTIKALNLKVPDAYLVGAVEVEDKDVPR